jgi:hypothetical protein
VVVVSLRLCLGLNRGPEVTSLVRGDHGLIEDRRELPPSVRHRPPEELHRQNKYILAHVAKLNRPDVLDRGDDVPDRSARAGDAPGGSLAVAAAHGAVVSFKLRHVLVRQAGLLVSSSLEPGIDDATVSQA